MSLSGFEERVAIRAVADRPKSTVRRADPGGEIERIMEKGEAVGFGKSTEEAEEGALKADDR